MEQQEITDSSYLYKSLNGQFNVDEAKGVVEAFVAGIGNKDSVNDICLPGCFTNSLSRRKPRVVWGHDWNHPIGKVLEIYEVGPNDPRLPSKMRKAGIGGLYVKVQFNLKAEKGKEAFANVSFFGLEQEWSIGYKTLDAVFDPVQNANLLKEVELYEVSPVLHGANQLTGTISIKADKAETENKDSVKGAKKPVLKDPKGGLTAAGRAHFKRTEGANLKPGVKGAADTPEKMRRKGSFLTRFFTNPSGPMKKPNGKPTRLALSAAAWGEPVPQDMADAAKLAAKGRRLLKRYENSKKKKKSDETQTQNKNHVDAIYAAYDSQANEAFGRASMLTRALAKHFGGSVRLVKADNDIAIFEMGAGTGTEMLRVAYHYDGDEFMFGTAQKVKPETVFIPVASDGRQAEGVVTSPSLAPAGLHPALAAAVPSASCCHECASGKTTCSAPKSLATWDEFLEKKNVGHHSLFVPEYGDDPEMIFSVLSTIGKHHKFSVKTIQEGFVVENYDELSDEAIEAINVAKSAFSQKGIGYPIRGWRNRGSRNPLTAIDADLDRLVLEGLPEINQGRGVPDPTPFGNEVPSAMRMDPKTGRMVPADLPEGMDPRTGNIVRRGRVVQRPDDVYPMPTGVKPKKKKKKRSVARPEMPDYQTTDYGAREYKPIPKRTRSRAERVYDRATDAIAAGMERSADAASERLGGIVAEYRDARRRRREEVARRRGWLPTEDDSADFDPMKDFVPIEESEPFIREPEETTVWPGRPADMPPLIPEAVWDPKRRRWVRMDEGDDSDTGRMRIDSIELTMMAVRATDRRREGEKKIKEAIAEGRTPSESDYEDVARNILRFHYANENLIRETKGKISLEKLVDELRTRKASRKSSPTDVERQAYRMDDEVLDAFEVVANANMARRGEILRDREERLTDARRRSGIPDRDGNVRSSDELPPTTTISEGVNRVLRNMDRDGGGDGDTGRMRGWTDISRSSFPQRYPTGHFERQGYEIRIPTDRNWKPGKGPVPLGRYEAYDDVMKNFFGATIEQLLSPYRANSNISKKKLEEYLTKMLDRIGRNFIPNAPEGDKQYHDMEQLFRDSGRAWAIQSILDDLRKFNGSEKDFFQEKRSFYRDKPVWAVGEGSTARLEDVQRALDIFASGKRDDLNVLRQDGEKMREKLSELMSHYEATEKRSKIGAALPKGYLEKIKEDIETLMAIMERRDQHERNLLAKERGGNTGRMSGVRNMPAVPKPTEIPEEVPGEEPKKVPQKNPDERPAEVPVEVPTEKPKIKPKRVPQKPERKPQEEPQEQPAKPGETPWRVPTKPDRRPAEQPVPARPRRVPERKPQEQPVPVRPATVPQRQPVPVRRGSSYSDTGRMMPGDPNYGIDNDEARRIRAGEYSGKSLAGKRLTNLNLRGADLRGTDLTGADITGTNFYEADLTGAKLAGAKATFSTMGKAKLAGADFSGAELRNAVLPEADARGASFATADMTAVWLDGADFSGTDLTDANLRGAFARGVNFTDANMEGADLREGYFGEAEMTGAVLSRAKVNGADTRKARGLSESSMADPSAVAPDFTKRPDDPRPENMNSWEEVLAVSPTADGIDRLMDAQNFDREGIRIVPGELEELIGEDIPDDIDEQIDYNDFDSIMNGMRLLDERISSDEFDRIIKENFPDGLSDTGEMSSLEKGKTFRRPIRTGGKGKKLDKPIVVSVDDQELLPTTNYLVTTEEHFDALMDEAAEKLARAQRARKNELDLIELARIDLGTSPEAFSEIQAVVDTIKEERDSRSRSNLSFARELDQMNFFAKDTEFGASRRDALVELINGLALEAELIDSDIEQGIFDVASRGLLFSRELDTGRMSAGPVPNEETRRMLMQRPVGGPGAPIRRARQEMIDAANKIVSDGPGADRDGVAAFAAKRILDQFEMSKLSDSEMIGQVNEIKRSMRRLLEEVPRKSSRDAIRDTFERILAKLTPEAMAIERSKTRDRIRNAGAEEMKKVFGLDDEAGETGRMARSGNLNPKDMERSEREQLGRKIWLQRTYDGKTLEDMARKYRMSREEVRQLELLHSSKLKNMDSASDNRIGRAAIDATSSLSDAEADLLRRRFDGELLEESAKRLRMDRNAVRRMEQLALRKIRDSIVSGEGSSGSMRGAGGGASDATNPKDRRFPWRKAIERARARRLDPSIPMMYESLRNSYGDKLTKAELLKVAALIRIKRIASVGADELLGRGAKRPKAREADDTISKALESADEIYEEDWATQAAKLASTLGSAGDFAGATIKRSNGMPDFGDVDTFRNATTVFLLSENDWNFAKVARMLGTTEKNVHQRHSAYRVVLSAIRTPQREKLKDALEGKAPFEVSLSSHQKKLLRYYLAGFGRSDIAEALNIGEDRVAEDLGRAIKIALSSGFGEEVSGFDSPQVEDAIMKTDESGLYVELTFDDGSSHRNYLAPGTISDGVSGAMSRAQVIETVGDEGTEKYAIVPAYGESDGDMVSVFPLRTNRTDLMYESAGAISEGVRNSGIIGRIVRNEDGSETLFVGSLARNSTTNLYPVGTISSRKKILSALSSDPDYAKSLLAKYDNQKNFFSGTTSEKDIGVGLEEAEFASSVAEKIRIGEKVSPEDLLSFDSVLSKSTEMRMGRAKYLAHDFDEEITDPIRNLPSDRRFVHVDENDGKKTEYSKRLLGMGSANPREFYLSIDANGAARKWNHPNNSSDEIGSWPDSSVGELFVPSRDDGGSVAYSATGLVREYLGDGETGAMSLPGENTEWTDEDDGVTIKGGNTTEAGLGAAAYLAISTNKPLIFSYYDSKTKKQERRSVIPKNLVRGGFVNVAPKGQPKDLQFFPDNSGNGKLYLVGMDGAAEKYFRVDKIGDIANVGKAVGGTVGAPSAAQQQQKSGGLKNLIKIIGHSVRPSPKQTAWEQERVDGDPEFQKSLNEILSMIGEPNFLDGYNTKTKNVFSTFLDALMDEKHPLHERAVKVKQALGDAYKEKLLNIARVGKARPGGSLDRKPLRRRVKPWGGSTKNKNLDVLEDMQTMSELSNWISDGDYVVFDFETTGTPENPADIPTHTEQGRPVQLVMHSVRNGQIVESKTWWVRPQDDAGNPIPLSGWTMKNVPGPDGEGTLTDDLVQNDPRFVTETQLKGELSQWLSNLPSGKSPILVGFNNANFDNAIIERILSGEGFDLGWFDVMVFADSVMMSEKEAYDRFDKVMVDFVTRKPGGKVDRASRSLVYALLSIAGYGDRGKNSGSVSLFGTADWEELLDSNGNKVLNEFGKVKRKINQRFSLEALKKWAGLKSAGKAHAADVDGMVTHEVMKALAKHAEKYDVGDVIFNEVDRRKLDDFLAWEWDARMQTFRQRKKGKEDQANFNFSYSDTGGSGGRNERSEETGGRRRARGSSDDSSIRGTRDTAIRSSMRVLGTYTTERVGSDGSRNKVVLPIHKVVEGGLSGIVIDYEFWSSDRRERAENQAYLFRLLPEIRTGGQSVQFFYGADERGRWKSYKIHAIELIPKGDMTSDEALEASRRSGTVQFLLAGTSADGKSYEFDFADIGNPNATQPRVSDYLPNPGGFRPNAITNVLTPEQYFDEKIREMARNRNAASRSDSSGVTGAMSGLTNRYGSFGGPEYWSTAKENSDLFDMDLDSLRSVAETSRRNAARLMATGRKGQRRAEKELIRMSDAEKILSLSSGPVFDDAGFKVSLGADRVISMEGFADFPNWRRRSSYFVPRGVGRRSEIEKNASLSVQLDRALENSPKGRAMSVVARNNGISIDELAARIESHDFDAYARATYYSRLSMLSRMVQNGSVDPGRDGFTIPAGSSNRDSMFIASRAMRILGAGTGDSGAMSSGDPYAESTSKYADMSDQELIDSWNSTIADLMDATIDGRKGRTRTPRGREENIRRSSEGRYADRNFKARAEMLKHHLEAIGAEIRRRFFESEEGQQAIAEILENPTDTGKMSANPPSSGGNNLVNPRYVLSGSSALDARIREIYGKEKWVEIASRIGARFSDLEKRNWQSPSDDDLVDLAHYVEMMAHDSIVSAFADPSFVSDPKGTARGTQAALYGVDEATMFASLRIGVSPAETLAMVDKGKSIARMRRLAAMTPFDRVEEMVAMRARAALAKMVEKKKTELSEAEFREWFDSAVRRSFELSQEGAEPFPRAGFFGSTPEEQLEEFFRFLGDDEGGTGKMAQGNRRFIEPRYDIKPHEGGWVIIDTKNRNAISSRVFADRLEALRGAKKMDRGDTSFRPYGNGSLGDTGRMSLNYEFNDGRKMLSSPRMLEEEKLRRYEAGLSESELRRHESEKLAFGQMLDRLDRIALETNDDYVRRIISPSSLLANTYAFGVDGFGEEDEIVHPGDGKPNLVFVYTPSDEKIELSDLRYYGYRAYDKSGWINVVSRSEEEVAAGRDRFYVYAESDVMTFEMNPNGEVETLHGDRDGPYTVRDPNGRLSHYETDNPEELAGYVAKAASDLSQWTKKHGELEGIAQQQYQDEVELERALSTDESPDVVSQSAPVAKSDRPATELPSFPHSPRRRGEEYRSYVRDNPSARASSILNELFGGGISSSTRGDNGRIDISVDSVAYDGFVDSVRSKLMKKYFGEESDFIDLTSTAEEIVSKIVEKTEIEITDGSELGRPYTDESEKIVASPQPLIWSDMLEKIRQHELAALDLHYRLADDPVYNSPASAQTRPRLPASEAKELFAEDSPYWKTAKEIISDNFMTILAVHEEVYEKFPTMRKSLKITIPVGWHMPILHSGSVSFDAGDQDSNPKMSVSYNPRSLFEGYDNATGVPSSVGGHGPWSQRPSPIKDYGPLRGELMDAVVMFNAVTGSWQMTLGYHELGHALHFENLVRRMGVDLSSDEHWLEQASGGGKIGSSYLGLLWGLISGTNVEISSSDKKEQRKFNSVIGDLMQQIMFTYDPVRALVGRGFPNDEYFVPGIYARDPRYAKIANVLPAFNSVRANDRNKIIDKLPGAALYEMFLSLVQASVLAAIIKDRNSMNEADLEEELLNQKAWGDFASAALDWMEEKDRTPEYVDDILKSVFGLDGLGITNLLTPEDGVGPLFIDYGKFTPKNDPEPSIAVGRSVSEYATTNFSETFAESHSLASNIKGLEMETAQPYERDVKIQQMLDFVEEILKPRRISTPSDKAIEIWKRIINMLHFGEFQIALNTRGLSPNSTRPQPF